MFRNERYGGTGGTGFVADIIPYLPWLDPDVSEEESDVDEQPRSREKTIAMVKAQCEFGGLTVIETMGILQELLRDGAHLGMTWELETAQERMTREYMRKTKIQGEKKWNGLVDNLKEKQK